MNITRKDLNLLHLFHVLYQERNLTLAAQRMALSQPALSHKLNKLRHQFGDPLFVRAPRGLTPTPRAHELAAEVERLIMGLESFYERCEGQDFLLRPARLHLYSTDYVEQTLLPGLLPILRNQAPNLTLVTHNTRGQLPREALEKGTCDLAVAGFFTDLADSFHQQRLLSDDFVVLASRSHPRLGNGLDLNTFLACDHLLTTLTGDLDGLVDRALRAQGKHRRVVAGLSSFTTPMRMIQGTDLLLTCLRSLAIEAVKRDDDLLMYPLPLVLPAIEVMQIWHERTHADPLRQWFRQQLWAVAQEVAARSGNKI
ncbi:LysR family transcriptional regulator [Pseudomonas monteilii]|uniref:LysR family transcriptional regulator n=1 Tax=Pseudomonas monteilii TaxID=76759 RepID=A0AAE6RBU3_9PSED|nr:LysR family transcriptional regulator [Pseudomonas monteilii]QHB28198.1 LysR family transcriptional regulator [Pseudomonas monteilii]